jgi:hypothetical protein
MTRTLTRTGRQGLDKTLWDLTLRFRVCPRAGAFRHARNIWRAVQQHFRFGSTDTRGSGATDGSP